jgi:hypothetical protein
LKFIPAWPRRKSFEIVLFCRTLIEQKASCFT